jgi:hypothetical protein
VTSLKEQWQIDRQQRQQEVAQRQKQVQEALLLLQTTRQQQATQLRNDLNCSQLELQHETQVLLHQITQQRQLRSQEVRQKLNEAAQQRQQQGQEMAYQLQEFMRSLQAETAEFLSLAASDRLLMSEQIAQDLYDFRLRLASTGALIRSHIQAQLNEIQHRVAALQTIAQVHLAEYRQHRVELRSQLLQELAGFVENLRAEVDGYLAELALERQDRIQQLHQMLDHAQMQRQTVMSQLFQEIASFRTELKAYCHQLQQMVWGAVDAVPVAAPVSAPMQVTPLQKRAIAPSQAAKSSLVPVTTGASSTPVPRARRLSQRMVATRAIAAPKAKASRVSTIPSALASAPSGVAAMPVSLLAVEPEGAAIEQAVYDCILKQSGARLNEIETRLGINRFQAVDALRSLIQQDRITQRDRVYMVQEGVTS